MNTAAYVIIAAIVATGLYFCIRWLARSFSKFGGSRPVTCPENGKRILVEVDARHAAMTSALGRPDIRLQNCSRWPLKQDCGQECLVNLDVAPDDCLVSGVLMRWYEGKTCVYCRKKFEAVHWMDHRPALRTPEGTLIEWGEVTVEDMPTVLGSFRFSAEVKSTEARKPDSIPTFGRIAEWHVDISKSPR